MTEIVSEIREEIMERVTKISNEKSATYGIEIVDVRIKRVDLPPENEKFIFDRMKAERERIAKQYRAEGQEESAKIIAETEKEKPSYWQKPTKPLRQQEVKEMLKRLKFMLKALIKIRNSTNFYGL